MTSLIFTLRIEVYSHFFFTFVSHHVIMTMETYLLGRFFIILNIAVSAIDLSEGDPDGLTAAGPMRKCTNDLIS